MQMKSYRKRRYIGIRVSEREYQIIREAAEQESECHSKNGSINISRFIRNRVLDSERIKNQKKRQMDDLVYQIRKIGVNINQITKKVNADKVYFYDIKVVQEEQRKIESQVNKLIHVYISGIE